MMRFLFLSLLMSSLINCAGSKPKPEPPALRQDAILKELTDFKGAQFTLPQQASQLQILEFWASWCAPCREAMPHMDRLYRQYRSKGLSVIAINVDENPNDALSIIAQMRPQFSVAWDPYGEVQNAYGVNTLPTTVILDATGQPLMRLSGYTPENQKLIHHQIEMYLKP
jgi:thiol-disulfide isomerase/thioredoxin